MNTRAAGNNSFHVKSVWYLNKTTEEATTREVASVRILEDFEKTAINEVRNLPL